VGVRRRGVAALLQRHGQQPGRLVHDEERAVLVQDLERAGRLDAAPAGAARPIHPHADGVAGAQRASAVGRRGFLVVDEDLALRQRVEGTAAGAETVGRREELVEAEARRLSRHDPGVGHLRAIVDSR